MDEIDSSDLAPVAPEPGFTDIEAARLIGRVLVNAARRLGVEHGRNTPLRALCEGIIKAASQIGLDEHVTRHHVVTLPAGTPFENCLDPAFWGIVAERLRPCDRIDVFDAGGSFYDELLVRHASPGTNGRTKGGAQVAVLRHVEFDPVDDAKTGPVTHEVKFMGPAQGWCVLKIADGKVVAENLPDRSAAEKHALGLV